LITEDDLTPESLFGAQPWAASVAVQATQSRSEALVSQAVTAFAHAGLGDALARNPANSQLGPLAINTEAERTAAVERIRATGVDQLLSAWVPTGPTADAVEALRVALSAENIALKTVPRDWDIAVWPHSTHGFFRFWKAVGPWLAERQAAGA
jgi:deoxyribodipyrimidine photo-lyase